jgi:hypothetical protein
VLADGEWHNSEDVIRQVAAEIRTSRDNVRRSLHGLHHRKHIRREIYGKEGSSYRYRAGTVPVRFGIRHLMAEFNRLLAGARGGHASAN